LSASSEYLPRPIRRAPQYGHRLRTPEYFRSHLAHLTSEMILIEKPPFSVPSAFPLSATIYSIFQDLSTIFQ